MSNPIHQQITGDGNIVSGGSLVVEKLVQIFNLPQQPSKVPWHPPRAAVRFFGREEESARLANLLIDRRRLALVGPGGIGKTALAAKIVATVATNPEGASLFNRGIYCHDYYNSPEHTAALSGIIGQAGLRDVGDLDRAATVQRTLDHPDVLLYIEGAEKAENLYNLLILCSQAYVLLTTRDANKIFDLTLREVPPLAPEAALDLLSYHAQPSVLPVNKLAVSSWRTLAERLGFHPLALRLAGVWLLKRQQSPQEFIRLLDEDADLVWDKTRETKQNIHILLWQSAQAVSASNPLALEAWYALSLHSHAPVSLTALHIVLGRESAAVENLCQVLQDHSLAEPCLFPGEQNGEMERGWRLTHALLGQWGKAHLYSADASSADSKQGESPTCRAALSSAESDSSKASCCIASVVRDAIITALVDCWSRDLVVCNGGSSMPGGYPRYMASWPHWDAIIRILVNEQKSETVRASWFRKQVGLAHLRMGGVRKAEAVLRECWHIDLKRFGATDSTTLDTANNLAQVLQEAGKLKEAEALHRETLLARENTLGKSHSDTIASMSNLAYCLNACGKFVEARRFLDEVIRQYEAQGIEDDASMSALNNFACWMSWNNDVVGAETLHRKVLNWRKRALGPYNANTLKSTLNLGYVLRLLNRMDEAESLYREALQGLEWKYGPKHPDTLTCINNLAWLLAMKGKWKDALPWAQRAVKDALETLGNSHEATQQFVRTLGAIQDHLGPEGF